MRTPEMKNLKFEIEIEIEFDFKSVHAGHTHSPSGPQNGGSGTRVAPTV
jgi:hypothetical protein